MKMVVILFCLFLLGCKMTDPGKEVIVYTSVDQHYAEPVFKIFEEKTGIHVRASYDIEASKTTGLVNRLIAEKKNPKADIFWNGEPIQTMRLVSQGILCRYLPRKIPVSDWSDPEHYWHAFGGRIRVLLVNNSIKGRYPIPENLTELVKSEIPAKKIAVALPFFGTTATHAAMIWMHSGDKKSSELFNTLKEHGVLFLNGNSLVRDKVVSGDAWLGLTDSDDACAAISRGAPVSIYVLNQAPGDIGALVIPNTVALISGSPNPENGQKLIDFLLSRQSREYLAKEGWLQIIDHHVYHKGTTCPLPTDIHIQNIRLAHIMKAFEISQHALRELFFQ